MSSELAEYGKIFSRGQRIRVGIPLSDGNIFAEWAEILDIDADLLQIQLSRQVLPVGAHLSLGTMLELRSGARGSGYRCRSILVSSELNREISLRLTGEVILDELREYFRIDVYLPIRLHHPDSTDPHAVRDKWLQKRASTITRPRLLHHPGAIEQGDAGISPDWKDIPAPTAANISGGGLRANIPEKLGEGDLVHLEVYLPQHPPAILDMVGQVITTTPVQMETGRYYSTAMRFYYIDERDRDRIIQYVTTEQLAQLRHYRKGLGNPSETAGTRKRGKNILLAVAGISLLCLLLIGFFSWFVSYYRTQPKSEVQRIFENGIRQYLEKKR